MLSDQDPGRGGPTQVLSGVFLGEGSLVISCASFWLESGHEIRAMVSDIDEVAVWARDRGLPIIASADVLETLRAGEPFDYLFSIVNFTLLPDELLELPRRLPINYHDSPLPRYAGVNATNWAIINGEENHGITWHVMTEEVDAGSILEQRTFPIRPDDSAITLNARAYEEALEGFKGLTGRLAQGAAVATDQPTEGRSYFSRWLRPSAAGIVDWDRSADEIGRLVRGLDHGSYLNPLGKAKLYLGDRVVAVIGVEVDDTETGQVPGTVLESGPAGFTVAAGRGRVSVLGVESLTGETLIPARALDLAGHGAGDRLPSLDAALAAQITEAAAAYAPKERYWIKQLAELEWLAAPYAASSRPQDAIASVQSIRIQTPPEFRQALQARGVDAADGLTAAFLMYLARIHNRVEFDVGFRSAATSPPPGSEQVLAPYLPLRFSCAGTESLAGFADIFRAAREGVERQLGHALDLIGRTPQLRQASGPFAPPLVIERAGVAAGQQPPAPADLVVQVSDDGGEVLLYCDPAVVNERDLGRIRDQFATVLASLADDLELPIGEVATLPAAERARLLHEWNPAGDGYQLASSLAAAFEAQVADTPDRVALTYLDQHLTYRQLNRRANQVANTLVDRGAGPGVLVGLAMERSLELLVGLLGILKSGSGYLPLDPSYPAERVRYMVEHAAAPLVLTQRHLAAGLPESSARVVLVDETEGGEDDPAVSAGADHLAYVMYTSGSTGKPKGVQISHRNVLRLMEATRPWFEFGPDDVWTMFHSYAFDFSVWEIWGALLFGGRLVIPDHETTRSPRDFLHLLASEQVTVLNQTPSAFRQLIEADGAAETSSDLALRYVVFGGEALDLADLQPWVGRHGTEKPRLVNMYGITETTVHVTYRPLTAEDIDRNLGSVIGVPIPDLQIYVLDRWMQLTPVGMPGEIFVGGAGLARGYLNRPDLTDERFVPNQFSADGTARLYKTGDVARYLTGGDLEYLGRADHQIQLRGFRVELGEIETVLAAHPAVSKAIVDVKEQASGDKRLVAYYLGAEESVEPAELRQLAGHSLPEYMVPHHFVPLERIPLTPSGKLDRKALPAPPRERVATAASVLPRNDAERKIAGVWERLLDITGVGVDDTFFDLGGDSLSIVRANEELRTLFDRDLSMADMFRLPTVAKLAGYLSSADEGGDGAVDDWVQLAQQRRARRSVVRPDRSPGGSGAEE